MPATSPLSTDGEEGNRCFGKLPLIGLMTNAHEIVLCRDPRWREPQKMRRYRETSARYDPPLVVSRRRH